jgi:hypothetical protein
MVKHVISPQIPPVYLTDADRESGLHRLGRTRFASLHVDSFHDFANTAIAFR